MFTQIITEPLYDLSCSEQHIFVNAFILVKISAPMSGLPKELTVSHGFIVMGTEKLFLCHLPMFFMPEHKSIQVIFGRGDQYRRYGRPMLKKNRQVPSKPLIILNEETNYLKNILLIPSRAHGFFVFFKRRGGDCAGNAIIKSTQVTVKKILLFEQLNPKNKKTRSRKI